MSTNEDIVVAEACAKGQRTAQQFLYQKYAKMLYNVLYRYIGNAEETKDLLQDCFMKIFDKISQYKGNGSLEGWLKRLAVNESISYLRVKKRLQWRAIDGIDEVEEEEQPATFLRQEFTQDDVLHVLASLPEEYRIVFQLFALDDHSHKEIGEKLGIQENASRARFFRAKKMIKEKLISMTMNKR